MQGQRGAIGSLQETFGFNHGSTSSDDGVDQEICLNNLQNPAQDQLQDYMIYSNETSLPFYNPVSQERQNATGWSLGESSSAPNCATPRERKTNVGWSSTTTTGPGPSHFCNEQQFGPSDILSLSRIEENSNSNQIVNNTLLSQCSNSSTIRHDLNRSSVFEGHNDSNDDDDDCQVMECTPYRSDGTGKERMPSASASGTNAYLLDDTDGRPNSSLDGRRFCKRKTLEGYLAQSSGSGSSNYSLAGNSLWHSVPASRSITTGVDISAPTENDRSINLSEQVNPRLGLTMGRAITETPLDTPASRNAESSRRNYRVRINGSRQQDHLPSNQFPAVGDVGNVDLSSEQQLPRLLPNIPLELRSVSAAGNTQRQPVIMHVPSQHRNAQPRWNSTSSSRTGSLSSHSAERSSGTFEEPNARSVSRNISEHPVFMPSTDGRNLNQNPGRWSLSGRSTSVAGNVASSSHSSSSSGVHASSSTRVLQRNSSQYSRRLRELVHRSLLSSAGTEPGDHNGSGPPLRLSSAVSQEMELSGNHRHRPSSSRSAMMLERHLDGAIGAPHPWRSLAAAREGRSRLVTEIRSVLDSMRRGEDLRLEDAMMLDQSIFFGMSGIHDRHRDMRLDVDNMSYEELLALGERIGDVCTGLSEETISSLLKQRKYILIKTEESGDAEPCCICREEYYDGEDLGTLDCGHDFHTDCIKQWLTQKNLCPICKTTGLTT